MDLLFDLETLGVLPGCPILQIGAAWFEPRGTGTVREFSVLIDLEDSLTRGFRIEASTLEWWLRQNESVRETVFFGEPRRTVSDALSQFDAFCGAFTLNAIWCNGASFDFPVLKHAYDRLRRRIPWVFSAERDLRTLASIANVARPVQSETQAHNAIHDVRHHAQWAQAGFRGLQRVAFAGEV